MARRNRGRVAAGVYHVWRRSAGPTEMFRDDDDRTLFCNRLASSITKYKLLCHAFVLMGTHFHLVLSVDDDVMSHAIRDTFGPYAQAFNKKWGRSGHLRAEPFKLRRIEDDADLLGAVKYVVRNPVRAHMCEQPEDWPWSSYLGSAGFTRPFRFVDDALPLGILAADRAEAQRLLRIFVTAPEPDGDNPRSRS